MAAPDTTVLLDTLEKPASRFGKDAAAKRDALLLASLTDAYRALENWQGGDNRAWQWGKLQFSYMQHPMAGVVDEATRARINVGPVARGGGAYTLNQSSYRPGDFWQVNGPSFRLVVDVGNWDNSRAMNTPGQSGDPASAHYRDLMAPWAAGEYFPLLYTRAAVEAATVERIDLQPAN